METFWVTWNPRTDFFEALKLIFEHFSVLFGPLGRSLGWLGGHFGDSLVALVGNMVPCKMYGILMFFVGFVRVRGCPEGPGGSLWVILAAHWLPGC